MSAAAVAPAPSAAPANVDGKVVAAATTDLDGLPLTLAMQLTQGADAASASDAAAVANAGAADAKSADAKKPAASGAQAQGGADAKAKFTVKELQANMTTILEPQGYEKVCSAAPPASRDIALSLMFTVIYWVSGEQRKC